MTIITNNQTHFVLFLRESVDQTEGELIESSQHPREKFAPNVMSNLLLTSWDKTSFPKVETVFSCLLWALACKDYFGWLHEQLLLCTKEFFVSDRCQLCCGHLPWRHWIKLTTHFISIKQQPFSIISHPAGTAFAQVIHVLATSPIHGDIQSHDYVLFSHRNSCICSRKQQLFPLCSRMLMTQFWSLTAKLNLQQSIHVRLEGYF